MSSNLFFSRHRCFFAPALALVPLLAGLLTGCATYEAKPLDPSQTAAQFENRSFQDPDLIQFLVANGKKGDDTWNLQRLTLAAFYFHPDLEVAREQWATARAALITAGQSPNPTLSVQPQYGNAGKSWQILAATIDVPIETAGKRHRRIEEAGHEATAARDNITQAAWNVRSSLRQSLLSLYAAEETKRLLQSEITSEQKIVELLKLQAGQGALATTQITNEEVTLDHLLVRQQEAVQRIAESRALLAEAIGVPLQALNTITLSFDEFKRPPPANLVNDQLRNKALLTRGDILSGLANYAASESALQLEIAKQYPDVHLDPGYEFNQDAHEWGLGLSVQLPILNQNQGPIAEAKARREQQAALFLQLQAKVIGEIDRAIAVYRAALEHAKLTTALKANLDKQRQQTEAMLQAGDIMRQDLLDVQLRVADNQISDLEARIGVQQAVGDLENALECPLNLNDSLLQIPNSLSPNLAP